MPSRGFPYVLLPVLPLLLAASASAGVTLPIGNFACGLYEGTGPPGFSLVPGSTCDASATLEASPPAPGITGVSFGTITDVTWNPAGDLNGGVNDYLYAPGEDQTLETVVMQTSGPILGDNPGDQFIGTLPLHYSFSITPVSCESLVGANQVPCDASTDVSVTWNLLFFIQGPGVSNSDGDRGSVLSPNYFGGGNDIGSFSGDLSVPSVGGCCVLSPTTTISQNAGTNIVYVGLGLTATLPENDSATFAISIPQAGSFDFESAESIPEPATMGLLAAGLLLFAYRRLTLRS
jgi:hypothetical protein